MKFNWGTGILLFIIAFLVALFSFIYYTSTLEYDLVEKDYYPRELDYNTHMQKLGNTDSLENKVEIQLSDSVLAITFPDFVREGTPTGEILLYRPSAGSLDMKYDLMLDDSGRQFIPAGKLKKGKYIVKIDWQFLDKEYYQEQIIIQK